LSEESDWAALQGLAVPLLTKRRWVCQEIDRFVGWVFAFYWKFT